MQSDAWQHYPQIAMIEIDRSLDSASQKILLSIWRHKTLFLLAGTVVFVPAILLNALHQPDLRGDAWLISGQTSLTQGPDHPRGRMVTPEAISRIAESEEVVAAAVQKIGPSKVGGGQLGHPDQCTSGFDTSCFQRVPSPPVLSPLEAEIPRIKLGLTVHTETSSDVIRLLLQQGLERRRGLRQCDGPGLRRQANAALQQAWRCQLLHA